MRRGMLLPAEFQGTGRDLVTFAQGAEAHGFDSMWVSEVSGREVMSTVGWLLASTTTLRVGTAVASVYARDASTAAMAAQTLAELSGGRFTLGLGVSIRWLVELRGQQWETPLHKASTYLDAMATMDVRSPKPAEPAKIYFAAHGPKLVAQVRDRVDGIITINVPPAHTAEIRSLLRDDQELVVIKTIVPDTDPVSARALAREAVDVYLEAPQYWALWPKYGLDESDHVPGGSDRLIDMLVAWGDTDAIEGSIRDYEDAGATEVVLRLPIDSAKVDWSSVAPFARRR